MVSYGTMRELQAPRSRGHVLVVDDDGGVRDYLRRWLELSDYDVTAVESGPRCLEALTTLLPDVVLLDIKMPGMSGLEVLRRVHARHPLLPVIMVTGNTDSETVVEAMRSGAHDYLTKPVDETKLLVSVDNAIQAGDMRLRLRSLEREAEQRGYGAIIGESDPMRDLFRQMDHVAASDLTILILGESGTGKELVARALHEASGRRDGPFVALNCAAIPETLQESELFGHERGAFTGASRQHIGRFEQADGGTLFLDEVAELALPLQAKLLRAIQERVFRRVGGQRDIASDFRLLAATNRDLEEEIEAGRFREDLYYRLAVFELTVPPLRERPGDVVRIARGLVQQWAAERGGEPPTFEPAAIEVLERYPWPGNVRELLNAVRRAATLSRDGVLRAADLPPRVLRGVERRAAERGAGGAAGGSPEEAPDEPEVFNLEALERQTIVRAMRRTGGNLSEVVRLLGIGRTTLYRKLKKYNLRD